MTRHMRESTRRFYLPVVATLSLFVVFGVTVVLVSRGMATAGKQEPLPLLAERLDKRNNAYYQIIEAVSLLPRTPGELKVAYEDGNKWPYQPHKGTASNLLGVHRPNDDPVFLEYIASTKPATDLALKALEKPWFLHPPEHCVYANTPPEGVMQPSWGGISDVRREMWRLVKVLEARAILEPCSENPEADSCERLMENFRLARLINSDGFRVYHPFTATAVQIIEKASRDHLCRIAASLAELRGSLDPKPEFNLYWDRVLRPADYRFYTYRWVRIIRWAQAMWKKEWAVRHESLLRQASTLTYKEYERLRTQHPELVRAESFFKSIVPDLPIENTSFLLRIDGLLIVTALEMYKHDYGTYPGDLDALVPSYMPDVPKNLFTGRALTYRILEGDYVLTGRMKGERGGDFEFKVHVPQEEDL